MPKTVQIRDIDDDDYLALTRRAADAGMSVPELLRREVARIARRPSVEEWLRRSEGRASSIDRAAVLDSLEELRGEWPDAGR